VSVLNTVNTQQNMIHGNLRSKSRITLYKYTHCFSNLIGHGLRHLAARANISKPGLVHLPQV
jgi:hypothetical protein